jgi:uncharacterized repeat protein (TIGR04138 family)
MYVLWNKIRSSQEISFSTHLKIKVRLVRRLIFIMNANTFEQAINVIITKDSRFHHSSYLFLKETLDFTLNRIAEQNKGRQRHITGAELLIGFRDFALEQFGPMAHTLFKEWGLSKCQDVGDMVFSLIEEGVFGKQDSDTKEDFAEIYSFEEVFTLPFLPKKKEV